MKVLKVAFQIQPATKLAANMVIIVISNLFQNGIFFSKLLMGSQNEGHGDVTCTPQRLLSQKQNQISFGIRNCWGYHELWGKYQEFASMRGDI